jgi:hypothetical protein
VNQESLIAMTEVTMNNSIKPNEVLQLSAGAFIQCVTKSLFSFIKAGSIKQHPAIFVIGQPGIGKSQSIKRIKDELEILSEKKVVVTDVRLLLFNPIDLRGIPIADYQEKTAIWLKPHIFKLNPSDDIINILFLDELTSAPSSIQAAAYQIALDKQLGEHKLPDNTFVIAAGNRADDYAVTYEMPSALKNRFMHFEIINDFEDWLHWAKKHHIHDELIRFLIDNPKKLNTDNFQTESNIIITPRTYEMLSNVLDKVGGTLEENKYIVSSFLGNSLTELIIGNHDSISIKDILQGKVTEPPQNMSQLQQIIDKIEVIVDDVIDSEEKITNLLNYINIVPIDYGLRVFKKIAQSSQIKFDLSKIEAFNEYIEKVGESFKNE